MNDEGRGLYNSIEPPSANPTQLPLPILTPVLHRSKGVCLPVPVEPLLPKCHKESRKQRGAEGGIKCDLNLTDGGTGSSPTWESDRLAGRDVSYGDIEEKFEEGIVHAIIIRLEF